jgi:hypothetical protein
LISDSHLIVLAWVFALLIIKALSGHTIVRPWRHFPTQ